MPTKVWIVVLALLMAGCQRKQDEVWEAAATNPNVTPPTGPFCSMQPYHATGSHSQTVPWMQEQYLLIPNFDLSKGDTLAISYKCPECANWSMVPQAPSPAGMSYTVQQSTVTFYFQHVGAWVWALEAGITVCQ